jgi:hypothetical protein
MEKWRENFDGFWNCRDIYKLEKSLMRKLNVWPGDEMVNGKLMALFLSNLIFIIVPEVCFLYFTFRFMEKLDCDEISKNFQIIYLCRNNIYDSHVDYAQGLMEFLYFSQFNCCFLIFLSKRRVLKDLLEEFEEAWKIGETSFLGFCMKICKLRDFFH